MNRFTSFGREESYNFENKNLAMSISQEIKIENYPTTSIIAIGNPIMDITSEMEREIIHKIGLEWGNKSFADNKNLIYFNELEKYPEVTYTPGGSVLNTLRVASWILNIDENNKGKFKLTMLGCVGDDIYKDRIINALEDSKVFHILQIIPNLKTSRCGIGVFNKERCILTDIRASKKLSEDFVEEHKEIVYSHLALLIEGYILQEKFNLVKTLCDTFSKDKKKIILTLSSPFIVKNFYDKIKEVANKSDVIIGNMEEAEELAGGKGSNFSETFFKIHNLLEPKDRALIITCGSQGALCSKFNYQTKQLDYVLQSFPSFIKNDDIVDFSGAGDAFLGGFLANYLKGKELNSCCKLGNDAAGVVLRNIGCTFQKNKKLNLD